MLLGASWSTICSIIDEQVSGLAAGSLGDFCMGRRCMQDLRSRITCNAGNVDNAALCGLEVRDRHLGEVHDRVDIGVHVPEPVLWCDVCKLQVKLSSSSVVHKNAQSTSQHLDSLLHELLASLQLREWYGNQAGALVT